MAEPDVAVVAVPAAGAHGRRHNVVADGYLCDAFSYLFDVAGHFVSGDAGQLARELSLYGVKVAVTDGHRTDADFYLPFLRLVQVYLFYNQWFTSFITDCCFHGDLLVLIFLAYFSTPFQGKNKKDSIRWFD
jgi:hypothetical protein